MIISFKLSLSPFPLLVIDLSRRMQKVGMISSPEKYILLLRSMTNRGKGERESLKLIIILKYSTDTRKQTRM